MKSFLPKEIKTVLITSQKYMDKHTNLFEYIIHNCYTIQQIRDSIEMFFVVHLISRWRGRQGLILAFVWKDEQLNFLR